VAGAPLAGFVPRVGDDPLSEAFEGWYAFAEANDPNVTAPLEALGCSSARSRPLKCRPFFVYISVHLAARRSGGSKGC
jgi:hypothetical protein